MVPYNRHVAINYHITAASAVLLGFLLSFSLAPCLYTGIYLIFVKYVFSVARVTLG